MGDTHYRAVSHVGVFKDCRFHDHRVDVLAAANNHVFCAIDDIDESVFIDARDVARVMPALGERLRRRVGFVPVTLHDVGTLDP